MTFSFLKNPAFPAIALLLFFYPSAGLAQITNVPNYGKMALRFSMNGDSLALPPDTIHGTAPSVKAFRVDKPPVIDGKLDEPF